MDYYELRLYEMLPRRMPDMHHQMAVEIPPLFEAAGVPAPLAFWDSFAGARTSLIAYLLRWPSLDERMRSWGRFYADPTWARQYADAHGGAQMLERSHLYILEPSVAWTRHGHDAGPDNVAAPEVGGVHELWLVELNADAPDQAHEALRDTDLPCLARHGAQLLGAFNTCIGTRLPQAVLLLAWPDMQTRDAAMAGLREDAEVSAAREAERRRFGAPLLGASDTWLLQPTEYGCARQNLAART